MYTVLYAGFDPAAQPAWAPVGPFNPEQQQTMRNTTVLTLGLIVGGLFFPAALGQTTPPAQAQPEAMPLSECLAVVYPEGTTVKVLLQGTARLPGATGEAKVKRKLGTTEIEIELDGMKPAISYGGDLNTYVLWTVSPEGVTFNVGELVLRGARSRLRVTTPLAAFAMFVTAEPHYLVQQPRGLFVLQNTATGLARQKRVVTVDFEYSTTGSSFKYERATLASIAETEGQFRADRYQAIVAVRLADQAEAQKYAPEEFARARAALGDTQQAFAQRMDKKQLTMLAHRAIRLAVEARRLAEERAARMALEAERQANRERIDQLTRANQQAEAAAFRSGEEAKQAREAAGKARTEMEQAREQMLSANQEADRLARLKSQAETQAASARDQATAVYARLQGALNRVAETRETERGLIVNLPDILFNTGKSTLRSSTREVLSRIAGILLVAPEYRLSIEGHTDSVGRAQYNQRLSVRRAQSVRDYLVKANISRALMSSRGYGESKPVVSNRSASGRRKNRRVEIVIEGLTR